MILASHLMKRSMLRLSTIPKRSNVTSFYITLPEMPDDHVPNIGLMPVLNKFPKFQNTKPLSCFFDIGKACLNFEEEISIIINKLEESRSEMEFDELMQEMDKSKVYLHTVSGLLDILHLVQQPEFTIKMHRTLRSRIEAAVEVPYQSESLFKFFKDLQSKGGPSLVEKRLLASYVHSGVVAGMNIPDSKKGDYNKNANTLKHFEKQYLVNLDIQNASYSQEISDKKVMEEFPNVIKSLMCGYDSDPNEGPWAFNMNPILMNNFFTYCSSASLRSACWTAMVSRSTNFTNPNYKNSSNIEDIRGFRRMHANSLGKSNWAQIVINGRMAKTAEDVIDVLKSVAVNVRPTYENEIDSLIEFANTKGQIKEFEPCDIDYWRRHQLQEMIGVPSSEVMMYFTFERVWSEALSWCSDLLGVSFKQVDVKDKSILWHESVRLYEVTENDGTSLGFFYLDPFMRMSKKFSIFNDFQFVPIRPGSKIGSVPLAAIVGGLSYLNEKGEHVLTLNNVVGIFSMLGHLMQDFLPPNPYCDLHGSKNLSLDTVRMTPYFFSNWLRNPEFLKRLSKHCMTNETLDDAVAKKLSDSLSHLASHDLTQKMMISHVDLMMYSTDKFWLDIVASTWKHYHVLPYNRKNHFVCSYSSIVSGSYSCTFYVDFWAEMLAADIYTAFQECPKDQISALGRKYRQTALGLARTHKPEDSFREFMGRDPNYNAIVTINNIPLEN